MGGFLVIKNNNAALKAESKFKTSVQEAQDYVENFDILETINNVGNDEVFTPSKVCNKVLDLLPNEVWSNPNLKWLNPVDKNGVFLREIAIRLNNGLQNWEKNEEKRKKHILKQMLFSIGLTKFTAQVSRRTLYYSSQANRSFDGLTDEQGNPINGYSIGDGSWFSSRDGNVITPSSNHTFLKGKCVFCGINSNSKYTDPKQIEHYAYEFLHQKSLNDYFKNKFGKGESEMKFDIIIGNPPYQLSDGGGTGDSAKPIYHLFVNQAISLNPKYIAFIIPSRWMKGGKGLVDFRESMINDTRIEYIHDYENSKDVFPTVDLDGGVCYFLWNKDYNGKVNYTTHTLTKESFESKRFLKSDFTKTVIRDLRQVSIIEKVGTKVNKFYSEVVSYRNPYGFNADLFNRIETYGIKKKINEPFPGSVQIYGVEGKKGGAKRVISFIEESKVDKNINGLNKFKLFFSKAYMSTSTVPPEIIVGLPKTLCTETFLEIGPFETKVEALNNLKYIKTKFFRALLFFNRHSLNISKESFDLVPLIDFKKLKDIDDKSLFHYFDLNEDEISFIEEVIKPMN